ncbi:50S ribosome-binding GTPase [Phycisphaeraceae bacterium D3-23]
MPPSPTQDAALQRARSYWLAALFIVVPLPFLILPMTGAAWLNAAPGDAFPGGTRFTLMSLGFAAALAMLGMFARNQAYKSSWQGDIVTPAGYVRGNLYFFAALVIGAVGIALAGVKTAYPRAQLRRSARLLRPAPPEPTQRQTDAPAPADTGPGRPRQRREGHAVTRLHLATANTPGAIALLQLHGPDTPRILKQLTGRADWRPGRVSLCHFADIDEGLAVLMNRDVHAGDGIAPPPSQGGGRGEGLRSGETRGREPDADRRPPPQPSPWKGEGAGTKAEEVTRKHNAPWAQLMPHGGPRVVQLLIDHLLTLGCTLEPAPAPRDVYPEAGSPIEADMLHAIAAAASPAAIDLLARQPTLWRGLLQQAGDSPEIPQRDTLAKRSRTLDQLITPPTVVVVGRANVGKSTLTNALSGRAVSIVADLPGTTRDWVGALVELRSGLGSRVAGRAGDGGANPKPETRGPAPEIAVHWLDTPGLRASDDTVEQRAIALARSVIERANVLVVMRDAENAWPDTDALPRTPDLWVMNKCDEAETPSESAGQSPDRPLPLSAEHGHGLPALQHHILGLVGLAFFDDDTPWAFSNTLRDWAAGEPVDLDAYLRP